MGCSQFGGAVPSLPIDAGPSSGSGELILSSPDNAGESASVPFDTALYAVADRTVDVLLLRGPVEAPQRVLHVRLVWRPRPGYTPLGARSTNATVRYAVFRGEEAGVYEGSGFLLPLVEPGSDTFEGEMRELLLKLADRTEGFDGEALPLEARGRFDARRDDVALWSALHRIRILLRIRLGYPSLVSSSTGLSRG